MNEKKPDQTLESMICRLPDDILRTLRMMPEKMRDGLEEIRFRVGSPVVVYSGGREYEMFRAGGSILTAEEVDKIFRLLVRHSVYSYQEDIRNGFVTLDGGHRAGICGRAVTDRDGNVMGLKNISSINIRRGREVTGISDSVIPYITGRDGRVINTLIVSPPKCGKTTMLRDIIRNLSRMGHKVGVCDERCELAGTFGSVRGFDLGPRTDVIDACPKSMGILMLIRSMSPDVIVADEIGTASDAEAIERACVSGVAVIASMHGESYADIEKSRIGRFVRSAEIGRLIFLKSDPVPGTVGDIADAAGVSLLKRASGRLC